MTSASIDDKERRLEEIISGLESVIVAYSGGVDSSLVAYYARKTLGGKARVVIAVSPSLAEEELDAARLQAAQFEWELVEIRTDEVELPEYQRNDAQRCYFCKHTLFAALDKMAESLGVAHVAYGANADDLKDFRPGHRAAGEYGVVSPLTASALSKEEVRLLSRKAGLPSWDRPQAACLSSRFPTHVPVTVAGLSRVEQAERVLHEMGFRQVRVRHHDDLARIELELSEVSRLSQEPPLMHKISVRLKEIGYSYVTLDLEGYRQGSSNALAGRSRTPIQVSVSAEPVDNG